MTIVLLHSPFGPPSTWAAVAARLREDGHDVRNPSFAGLTGAAGPFWPRFVEAALEAMRGAHDVMLAGHSGAGPLLPAIGAGHGGVLRYLFVDATLPLDGYRRADTVAAEERASTAWRAAAARREAPNPWTEARTWRRAGIADPGLAARLAAETPPILLEMNDEAVAVPAPWPDAPVSYLAFTPNPFYEPARAEARRLGWPVREISGAHFHMLVDPESVAGEVGAFAAQRASAVTGRR